MASTLKVNIVGDAKALRSALKGAEGDLDGFAGKARGAVGTIGTVLGVGGAAAGAAFAAGVNEAMSIDAANDRLAAQLNLSEQASERAGEIAGDLYAGAYGDSVGSVNEALRAVGNGLADLNTAGSAEIEGLTAGVLDLSSAFEVDFASATGTARTLIANGLAPDASSALDIITAGFQSGLDVSGDFLETMNEYAEPFSSLGIDGGTALSILNEGLEAGAYNADKVGDALKEFSIRAIDGSTATADAYADLGLNAEAMAAQIAEGGPAAQRATSEIIRALSGMDDEVTQDAAGVALFGSMWEDLGPQVIGALDPATAAIIETDGALGRMGDTLNGNPQTNLTSFLRTMKTGAVEVIGGLVIPALGRFSGFLAENVGPVVQSVGETVLPVLQEALARLGAWWEEHGPAIQEGAALVFGAIGDGLGLVGDLLGGFMGAWDSLFGEDGSVQKSSGGLLDTLSELWDTIVSVIGDAWELISAIVERALSFIADVWEKYGEDFLRNVTTVWDGILSTIEGVLQVIRGIIQTVLGLVTGDWSRAWEGIQNIVSGAWDAIGGIVRAALGIIRNAIDLALAVISSVWDSVWQRIANVLSSVWDGIRDAVSSAIGWVRDRIADVLGTIADHWRRTWEAAGATLGNVWGGIRDTVAEGIEWARDRIASVTGTISASWETFWSDAQTLVEDVWDAITSKVESAMNTAADWVETGVSAIGTAWEGLKSAAALPINFVINRVWNDGLRSAWNAVANIIPGVGTLDRVSPIELNTGGRVPGSGPDEDSVYAYLTPGEWVLNRGASRYYGPELLEALNRKLIPREALPQTRGSRVVGGDPVQALNVGGPVQDAKDFARAQNGKPYLWGGVGPHGYDCSGFLSAIQNVLEGRRAHSRRFTSASIGSGGDGWQNGSGGLFDIGTRRGVGKGSGGHVAGTLDGLNVESAGSVGVRVGGGAWGAGHPYFTERMTYAASGGLLREWAAKAASGVLSPVRGMLTGWMGGQPPIGQAAGSTGLHAMDSFVDWIRGGTLPGLASGGTVTGSGTVVVGEEGPELLRLGSGASVVPLTGGPGQVIVTPTEFAEDVEDTYREVERLSKVYGREVIDAWSESLGELEDDHREAADGLREVWGDPLDRLAALHASAGERLAEGFVRYGEAAASWLEAAEVSAIRAAEAAVEAERARDRAREAGNGAGGGSPSVPSLPSGGGIFGPRPDRFAGDLSRVLSTQ